MHATILAKLREWYILIIGFCIHSWRGNIVHSFYLINTAGIGGGRADRSQFSAAGISKLLPRIPRRRRHRVHPLSGHRRTRRRQADPRRRRSRRHTRCLATAATTSAPARIRALPGVARTAPVPRHCGERPSGATRYSNTPNTGWRDGCRRRCGGGPPGLPKMPGLPLAGGRKEHARPEPRRHHRQEVRRGSQLQLFTCDEGRQFGLGRCDTRRLSARSAKAGAEQQDAVPRIEDRERAQGCDRLSGCGHVSGGRTGCRAARAASPAALRRRSRLPRTNSALLLTFRKSATQLRSGIAEGRMVYLGVGGTIDGQVNPLLSAAEGQIVQIS